MAKRFSKQTLHKLRNDIPIQNLIETKLKIPNRYTGSIFRFECPNCHGFHTGILHEKNLARCFDCKRNFNTIDFVIAVMDIEFYESAGFLEQYLNCIQTNLKNNQIYDNNQIKTIKSNPVSIGNVLSQSEIFVETSSKLTTESDLKYRMIKQRVQHLENEMNRLKQRIEDMHRFLVHNLSDRSSKRGDTA